jgi:hypothetical protein
MSKDYNGWANWETWNLMLHLNNTHCFIVEDFMSVNCWIKPKYHLSNGEEFDDLRECENFIKDSYEDLYGGEIEDRFFVDNHHINWREITKAIFEMEEWNEE